jgi:hypothetical protein
VGDHKSGYTGALSDLGNAILRERCTEILALRRRYPHQVDLRTVRYSERPELWDATDDLFTGVWPEYNLHGEIVASHWGRLFEEFPQYQFALLGQDEQVLARGHTRDRALCALDPVRRPAVRPLEAGA